MRQSGEVRSHALPIHCGEYLEDAPVGVKPQPCYQVFCHVTSMLHQYINVMQLVIWYRFVILADVHDDIALELSLYLLKKLGLPVASAQIIVQYIKAREVEVK